MNNLSQYTHPVAAGGRAWGPRGGGRGPRGGPLADGGGRPLGGPIILGPRALGAAMPRGGGRGCPRLPRMGPLGGPGTRGPSLPNMAPA